MPRIEQPTYQEVHRVGACLRMEGKVYKLHYISEHQWTGCTITYHSASISIPPSPPRASPITVPTTQYTLGCLADGKKSCYSWRPPPLPLLQCIHQSIKYSAVAAPDFRVALLLRRLLEVSPTTRARGAARLLPTRIPRAYIPTPDVPLVHPTRNTAPTQRW